MADELSAGGRPNADVTAFRLSWKSSTPTNRPVPAPVSASSWPRANGDHDHDDKRRELIRQIDQADAEIAEMETAFHRAEGDDAEAARLEDVRIRREFTVDHEIERARHEH